MSSYSLAPDKTEAASETVTRSLAYKKFSWTLASLLTHLAFFASTVKKTDPLEVAIARDYLFSEPAAAHHCPVQLTLRTTGNFC